MSSRVHQDPAVTAGLLLEAVPPLVCVLRRVLHSDSPRLTLTQAWILARLEGGPRLVGELAGSIGVRPPTASVAVNGLVRRGLVTRLADRADRRVVPVALTPEGRRVLAEAHQHQLERLAELLSGLDSEELQALQVGLPGLARVASQCLDVASCGAHPKVPIAASAGRTG